MTNSDIALWYRALGFGPGCHDWRAVRNRYRTLIRQLHPDRLPADTPERAEAEERAKQINVAYRALANHYRRHGTLPPYPDTMSYEAAKQVATCRDGDTTTPENERTPRAADAASSWRKRVPVVPLLILLAVGYLALTRLADTINSASTDANGVAGPSSSPSTATATPRGDPFTYGDTPGAVYAAQGVPDRVADNVWHYGHSTVRFTNGHVESWHEHPDHPLNARLATTRDFAVVPTR
jgi:hypothetical protein